MLRRTSCRRNTAERYFYHFDALKLLKELDNEGLLDESGIKMSSKRRQPSISWSQQMPKNPTKQGSGRRCWWILLRGMFSLLIVLANVLLLAFYAIGILVDAYLLEYFDLITDEQRLSIIMFGVELFHVIILPREHEG